jgi:hypothetical protein
VVSVTDPYGRNLGFLDRSRTFLSSSSSVVPTTVLFFQKIYTKTGLKRSIHKYIYKTLQGKRPMECAPIFGWRCHLCSVFRPTILRKLLKFNQNHYSLLLDEP